MPVRNSGKAPEAVICLYSLSDAGAADEASAVIVPVTVLPRRDDQFPRFARAATSVTQIGSRRHRVADPKKIKDPVAHYTGLGMALGLGFGAAFGAALGDTGTGLAVGLAVGLATGVSVGKRIKEKQKSGGSNK